ncbi:MAG: type II secretion system F family protein [Candidatus Aenigmatarchaeota archaeon]
MKKEIFAIVLGAIPAFLMFTISFLYFAEIPNIFSSLNIVALFVLMLPIVILRYSEYRKKKEIEEMFPVFLRDFVEAVRGGMTIPHAFKSVSSNDYKSLTPYVKKMAAQMGWGIPADKVLLKFSKEVKSRVIGRIISSVIESHRFGGNLADTFEALSNTAVEVERLRTERRLYMHSQMITGYIIFFVFLGVMVGLSRFLIPSLTQVSLPGMEVGPSKELTEEYKTIFRNLILIQGFFAGLSVGKMAEGAVVAGLKHSIFMMFVGTVIFLLGS